MKSTFIVLGLLFSFLLTGCMGGPDIGCLILEDIFGWLPGYESDCLKSSTSSSSSNSVTGNAVLPVEEEQGGFINEVQEVWESFSDDDEKEEVRECTFDQDCSPSGADKAVCSGTKYSLRYRCDLSTYTCTPRKGVYAEKIDCTTDFGVGYQCDGGYCRFKGPSRREQLRNS